MTPVASDVESAYASGRQQFCGIELIVEPGALVPRAETELLARSTVAALASVPSPRVIDMCCGSGNLAAAIASLVPTATVWASDLTDGSVAVARKNVAHLGLSGRMTVVQGDLFAPLAAIGLEDSIDFVVCNPPYISSGRLAADRATLLDHEPREAFDGGPYGLTIHQRVMKEALGFLRPGGRIAFEIGLGQDKQVTLLFGRARGYHEITPILDEAGAVRVMMATKR